MNKTLPPDTPEQARITNYQGNQLIVRAYAGTGKTTTLIKYALANPRLRMLYIAYNRAIRDEAAEKFPRNVTCKTSHQLAFASVGRMFAHKLVGNIRLTDIAQALNTKNWTLARDCLDTLNAFMCSADDQILYDHFERADTGLLLTTKQERYVIEVVQSAEDIWKRMCEPQDPFPMVHDGYLKLYQLSHPNLSLRYQVILFDEAQDANPVTSDIVIRQRSRTILVGDVHQQIYRFRGANDAMNNPRFSNADQLYLTHSFRFGPNVAMVANALLELKGETKPVIGRGAKDQVLMMLPQNIGHHAVLHRTVMGVIQTALGYTGAGHKVFWAGGIESYQIDYLEDIFWFSREERERVKNKQILNDYEDYQEFTEIARATQDNEMFRAMAIIEAYEDLPEHLAILRLNTVKDELVANVTVSTSHRAKGLEWDYVQLFDDFPDVLDPELEPEARDDEINLLYVASTRAMRALALNASVEMVIRYITHKRQLEKIQQEEATNNQSEHIKTA